VISKTKPTICAFSRNLSLGFFAETISYNKKTSRDHHQAGIGNKFITPSIIDNKAVMFQKLPSSMFWKNIKMALKPPTCL
jgi:hypothetical protein